MRKILSGKRKLFSAEAGAGCVEPLCTGAGMSAGTTCKNTCARIISNTHRKGRKKAKERKTERKRAMEEIYNIYKKEKRK